MSLNIFNIKLVVDDFSLILLALGGTVIYYALYYFLPEFGYLLILNVITFVVYALDKFESKYRIWRIPNNTLLLLGLIGGWPFAIIAQQTFRHEINKQKPFHTRFIWSVAFNIILMPLYYFGILSYLIFESLKYLISEYLEYSSSDENEIHHNL